MNDVGPAAPPPNFEDAPAPPLQFTVGEFIALAALVGAGIEIVGARLGVGLDAALLTKWMDEVTTLETRSPGTLRRLGTKVREAATGLGESALHLFSGDDLAAMLEALARSQAKRRD